MSENDARSMIEQYRKGSSISVESLAGRIREWLDKQDNPNMRLNFFIDEVGQFISGKTQMMLNLQTIAETLGTVCGGRVWLFVTSQEDLTSVVGDPTAQQVQDFSKINARFFYRFSLSSADVQEVIQKRLLEKTAEGREALGDLFMRERETFRTLFHFEQGGRQIFFRDKEHFILSYPFQAYQYDLLQQSLRGLSEHNAFRGQHVSQGERSMLVIFQDVAKSLKNDELFAWATFDQMFEGIRQILNTSLIHAINVAEQNLKNPVAIKLLKILLLVKYVRVFKATHEHLKILLIRELGQDLRDLDARIAEALNLLEYQTYIQRNGTVYEYLTNEEKDVENEIKRVEVGHDDLRKFISETVFSGILKFTTSKIRDDEILEDFAFSRIIDGETQGKAADLGIHIISPDHPNYDSKTVLLNQSMGKKEMLVVLDADDQFQRDLRLYFQTDAYCRKQHGMEESAQIQRIISDKLHQNNERRSLLREQLAGLLKNATIYVMGDQFGESGSDPSNRIYTAFKSLVRRSYPKLRMLSAHHYVEGDLKKILYPDDGNALFGGEAMEMDEAQKEMAAFVQREYADKENLSLKRLIDTFSYGQFGWYYWGIICVLARLYARDRVSFVQGNNEKSREEVFTLLSGSREHDQVRVRPVEEIDDKAYDKLRTIYRETFNRDLPGSSAKESAIRFKADLLAVVSKIEDLLRHEAGEYLFLEKTRPLAVYLRELVDKEWAYYLKSQDEWASEFIRRWREELEPLREFMHGSQKDIWKELHAFLVKNGANLRELDRIEELEKLNALLTELPYRDGTLRQLKQSVKGLKEDVEKVVAAKKEESVQYLQDLIVSFEAADSFENLEQTKKDEVIRPLASLISEVERQSQLALIRDIRRTKGPRAMEDAQVRMHKILNPEAKILFARPAEKHVPFTKNTLVSEEDVHEYAEALKEHYLMLVRQHKRISL
ncbi:BREX system P-loop protein BrxC [Marispirochaeta aestuarii]|uniref:BREX system P-loop protein BrxC n=1 Tax=Marispirochaeta aestuarii TaxID=1963862 RepID=UPI0029C72133|nr:BREX system P-loop protein BrxC [Marispirochaeta aestuarii]